MRCRGFLYGYYIILFRNVYRISAVGFTWLPIHDVGLSLQKRLEDMYAQIVYKDRKIIDLNNKVLDHDRIVIDLQELVGEKEEVIRGRDKAIQVGSGLINYI